MEIRSLHRRRARHPDDVRTEAGARRGAGHPNPSAHLRHRGRGEGSTRHLLVGRPHEHETDDGRGMRCTRLSVSRDPHANHGVREQVYPRTARYDRDAGLPRAVRLCLGRATPTEHLIITRPLRRSFIYMKFPEYVKKRTFKGAFAPFICRICKKPIKRNEQYYAKRAYEVHVSCADHV